MQEIFRFIRRRTGRDGSIEGEYTATGIRPHFVNDFESRGIDVAAGIFEPNRPLSDGI
jgi:pilus assembly protein CpaF